MTPERSRTLTADGIDLGTTLQPIGVFPSDPTHRWLPGGFAKAVLTPSGPGTVELRWNGSGAVDVGAWGPGATWLLDASPDLVGLHDDLTGFDPTSDPRVDRWWRLHGRFRLCTLPVIWQQLVPVLLGQRVTTDEAARSWAGIVRRWGAPAPGPHRLWMPPAPEALAAATYVDLHAFNVERRRAEAILLAARRADRLEEAAAMPTAEALDRLTALPGLGMWTATSVLTTAGGDPDVVVLRDYGLPTLVNYAFTGRTERIPPDEGGDALMCAHLAPWAGHRGRIIRLLFAAGVAAPRRAPRAAIPDNRRR